MPDRSAGPRAASAGHALRLNGVRKSFRTPQGRVAAVDGLDLSVLRGEIVAFLGPNGAGKTTAIDLLLGLTLPDSGTVEVLGTTPRRAVRQGRVSAVLQTGGLLRDLTVRETVTAIASLHGVPHRAAAVMERTDTARLRGRRVSKCSGGEQQRLKFALALLPDPDLLVLDEPTAGMDVPARREFWDAMRQDADAGRTILFATHHLEEAERFARRTVLIAGGRIAADGPTERIRALAAGRTLGATVDDPDAVMAALRNDPGVRSAESAGGRAGGRIEVTATDTDRIARTLLADHGARDLEISAPSLEKAFIDLTAPAPEGARP